MAAYMHIRIYIYICMTSVSKENSECMNVLRYIVKKMYIINICINKCIPIYINVYVYTSYIATSLDATKSSTLSAVCVATIAPNSRVSCNQRFRLMKLKVAAGEPVTSPEYAII